jgi:hypothetical protein
MLGRLRQRMRPALFGLVMAFALGAFAPDLAAQSGSCCFNCGGHEVCCNYENCPGGSCISTSTWCRVECGDDWMEAECIIIEG